MHKDLLGKAGFQQWLSSLGPHVRITEIISDPTGLQTELIQLFLSRSPGVIRKDRNRETSYGFLGAHLFQQSSVLLDSAVYLLTVILSLSCLPPFYFDSVSDLGNYFT